MFGLAQLDSKLRGRVGRSKTRAYAYFTTPPASNSGGGETVEGSAFARRAGQASHWRATTLILRGAGNLLGEEQGISEKSVSNLISCMLEEAVAAMKGGDIEGLQDQRSPEISLEHRS